jgi:hypothetical protein
MKNVFKLLIMPEVLLTMPGVPYILFKSKSELVPEWQEGEVKLGNFLIGSCEVKHWSKPPPSKRKNLTKKLLKNFNMVKWS